MLAYGWSDLEGSTVDENCQLGWWVFQWDKVAWNTLPHLGCWFRASLSTSSPKTVTDPDAPELAWEASLKYKVSNNITIDSGNLLSA